MKERGGGEGNWSGNSDRERQGDTEREESEGRWMMCRKRTSKRTERQNDKKDGVRKRRNGGREAQGKEEMEVKWPSDKNEFL